MRTFVIGDIHGCYYELKSLLNKIREEEKYNNKIDKLVFIGDYIDRGDNSRLVIKLIKELQNNNNNVIALMGNHEDMLINYLNKENNSWMFNGANSTLNSYMNFDNDFQNDVKWIKQLPLYYEDNDFIYVHAGLDLNKPLNKQERNTILWIREDFIYSDIKYDKRIIYGHTPTIFINENTIPYSNNNNICIDTGCVYGGALTALVIEDSKVKKFVQVKNFDNKIV